MVNDKSRASSVKSGITGATKKRMQSAKYDPHLGQPSPRKSFTGGFGTSGILKSGRKKSRPRTADRFAGVYDPGRGGRPKKKGTLSPYEQA